MKNKKALFIFSYFLCQFKRSYFIHKFFNFSIEKIILNSFESKLIDVWNVALLKIFNESIFILFYWIFLDIVINLILLKEALLSNKRHWLQAFDIFINFSGFFHRCNTFVHPFPCSCFLWFVTNHLFLFFDAVNDHNFIVKLKFIDKSFYSIFNVIELSDLAELLKRFQSNFVKFCKLWRKFKGF